MEDKLQFILSMLTATQSRRYNLYLKGYSLTEIAAFEGVSITAIHKSIVGGKKRIKKRTKGLV